MKQKENVSNFQNIIENLTPESQIYLLNMANMARIAESSKQKELEKNKAQSKMNTEICELVGTK